MKRIAVLTSGGDAPGMNAAIRSVTRTAAEQGVEVFGVNEGFAGLIEGSLTPLGSRDVSHIIEQGGTMLGSARSLEFKTPAGMARAIGTLSRWNIEGLIVIGGNGSQTGTLSLVNEGVPVNGVASTIDNDLCGSDITIGVDTALNVILESVDRLRTTATSHHRCFLIEVMGRKCGYLALTAGLAGGAEVIVTPEYNLSPEVVRDRIHDAHARGKRHAMVVVAEGATHNAQALYDFLKSDRDFGFDPRLTILGHVQRGGRPTAFDRLLATRLAAHAVNQILSGKTGLLAGLIQGRVTSTPLSEIVGKTKPLPEDLVALAESMKL